MKVVVVEDSRLAREGLVRMLRAFEQIEIVGVAEDAEQALALIRRTAPDVLFLDIHLPGASGFDLLERLDSMPALVFTTAYSEYAIRSFDFNTVDYLLKPISAERLAQAIRKLSGPADAAPADDWQPVLDIGSKIFIKDGERCHLVALDAIRYIESCKNYAQIFFGDQRAYVKKSLSAIEARLPPRHFFRVSRQHIVNLHAITGIAEAIHQGYDVTLTGGTVVEVSRRHAAQLKELLSL